MNKKKKRGASRGKGVRHPELHAPGKGASPAQPPKPTSSVMLVTGRRLVTIAWIEVGEWERLPSLDMPTESVAVQAVLTNGFFSTPCVATVTYEEGEREALMLAVLSGDGGEREVDAARRILERRAQAVEGACAALHKRYGVFEVAPGIFS